MANEWAKIDQNNRRSLTGVDDTTGEIRRLLVDDQGRLLVTGVISDFSFLDLTDTPDTYAGSAGYVVMVNPGEDGLIFSATAAPTTFLGLTDTPSSYVGQAGFIPVVNAGETALEFLDPNTLTDAEYNAVVCGSGGTDYATLKEAIDDNKNRILVICDTTEIANSDIVVASLPSADMLITIVPGVTVNMGAFRITDTGTLDSFTMNGGGQITYAHTSANEELLDLASLNGKLRLHNITIDNNSTADGCYVNTNISSAIEMVDVRVELPNQASCGLQGFSDESLYHGVTLVGGGTSCTLGANIGSCRVSDLLLTGTFALATTDDAIFISSQAVVSNLACDLTGASGEVSLLMTECTVNGVNVITAGDTIRIDEAWTLTNASTSLNEISLLDVQNASNCYLNNGTINLGSVEQAQYVNIGGVSAMTVNGSSDGSFTNLQMDFSTAALTIDGDRNKFTGCMFDDGVIVASGADDNGFMNCQFGDSAGGTETITINAGSNDTRVIGCITDAAIVDNGTGTVLIGNVVY